MPTFVCTTTDVDETQQGDASPRDVASVRDLILSMWDVVEGAKNVMKWGLLRRHSGGVRSLHDFRAYLMYAVEMPSRRKRVPMNVEAMVQQWLPIIRGLSTAHDKRELDKAEFDMDHHLTPLLTAPVKQIRQFYDELCQALESDPTIPFFIWSWFQAWGEVMLKKAPDADVKELKTALAAEIAELVEADVQPDLKRAITGALQWRSEESLTKIRSAVSRGGKARMVGKESCLFLEVEVEGQTERVML